MKQYQSQSARDAQAGGYGDSAYWDYLDKSAKEHSAYFRKHGDEEKANKQLTQSLSEALQGNDGD